MRFWVLMVCSLSAAHASGLPAARVREAATKAVAMIQKSQQNWYANQSCTSCHQQLFPALAFRAARDHGIPVDEQAAGADARAAFGYFSKLDRAVEYTHVIDAPLNDGYAMLGADAAGVRPSLITAVYARLLSARQEADGRWETIDQRPPQSYSPFTATAISVRALELYTHPSQRASLGARLERARSWLLTHEPHATEERAFQLLGGHWAGADRTALFKLAAALAATQQADGGWASLDGRPSDAYSTAQALIALHEAGGTPVTAPAFTHGIEYLLKTQATDGSWHVESRLHPPAPVSPRYFETGHPYGHDQFVSMMGECLAVMALAEALGPAKSVPLVLKEAEPPATEPWVETMLFGTAAQVKLQLDDGLDPNAGTIGGVTALMLAAPDLDKMKLLVDRGANVEVRAKNRFSALLVTAQYPDAIAAMNLLLDHGAKVRLPAGQGAPLFNANPMFLAANSGNAGIIARLQKEGEPVDDPMNILGMIPMTPLLFLSPGHRTDSVRALLDAGLPVDTPDNDGITALAWTAISNRLEMAKLLIERGADVNHVDKLGMTPLLYAASIDYGNSAMIDLLLKNGAKLDARTPDGLTSLALARKYNHTHLVGRLQSAAPSGGM